MFKLIKLVSYIFFLNVLASDNPGFVEIWIQYFSGIMIPHTILIGLAAGLFNLIPFVGPIMGLIPAIVLYLITEQAIPLHIFYIILI